MMDFSLQRAAKTISVLRHNFHHIEKIEMSQESAEKEPSRVDNSSTVLLCSSFQDRINPELQHQFDCKVCIAWFVAEKRQQKTSPMLRQRGI